MPERYVSLPSQSKRGADRLSRRRSLWSELPLAAFDLHRRRRKRLRLRVGDLYLFLTPYHQCKASAPASGQVMIGHWLP